MLPAQPNMDGLEPANPLVSRMIGKRLSPSCMWRWHKQGILVDGRRVRLEVKRIGGELFTTPADVERFIEAQNQRNEPDRDDAPERSPETERKLREAGLLSDIQAQQVDSESDDDPPERSPETERKLREAGLLKD